MSKYELESVSLPRLSGWALKALARALESRPSRSPLSAQLLKDAGIAKLRKMQISEPPLFLPLPPAGSTEDLDEAREPESTRAPESPPPHSAVGLVASYVKGTQTPVDVAERVLSAIADSDAHPLPLCAFIALDRDDVLTQARASARRYAEGAPLGPLDGVPVAIKDEVDQVPYPTTAGTRIFGKVPAVRDATAVARLRAAGALLLGKANMHEIGINPNGLNVHYGVARNPVDREREAGGSSGGSAASVAAGFCPLALGADGGGSIRVPAALCGVVGLKPTFGRVSEHGAVPLCWSVAHIGPIGATMHDVALGYSLMAGPDAADPNTQGLPPVTLGALASSDLSGLRIGVYRRWFEHAEDDIVERCEGALEHALRGGARICEIEIPELDEMRIAHAITILSEMAANMSHETSRLTELGPGVRVNLALGRALTASDYLQAQRMRARAMGTFERAFDECDVIATPATAITAPRVPKKPLPHGWSDLSTVTELMRFIVPGNLCGLPALSLPVGVDAKGLPVGLQLMARHYREDLLFTVGNAIELASRG